MQVQIKSSNGISIIPIETRLLANRKIFLEGEINHESAVNFVKQLLFLTGEDSELPIDVFVNSGGGEITAGMMIYDAISSSPAPIRMICIGQAYSMAAVLFTSGMHGRYMLPNSELMLHEPLLGNHIGGNASSIRSVSESLQQAKHRINAILAKHTGKTEKEIEEVTGYDHYFTPEEAIAFCLCDKVIGLKDI